MPDRAVIPFTVSVMGGFFCGLIGSVLELQNGPIVAIAVAGAIAALIAALVSVAGCEGEDRGSVAILRAFFAVCLFLAIDLGLVSFLRDAHPFAALVLFIGAAISAGMLASPRVRQADDERTAPRGGGAQGAA